MCIYIGGEDFYWLRSFNAESNEIAVGEKKMSLWAPGPLCVPSWAPMGPYGPGPSGGCMIADCIYSEYIPTMYILS